MAIVLEYGFISVDLRRQSPLFLKEPSVRPVIVCLVAWVVVGNCAGFIHAASDNWIFTKIAETGGSIPEGGGNTFLSISDASIDDGQIVFIGGGQRVRGVYKWRDGVLTALADTAPGGDTSPFGRITCRTVSVPNVAIPFNMSFSESCAPFCCANFMA
jgi:hypothetical protein